MMSDFGLPRAFKEKSNGADTRSRVRFEVASRRVWFSR